MTFALWGINKVNKVHKSVGGGRVLLGLLYENTACVYTILHTMTEKLGLAKVLYLYTNIAILTRKYSSTDGEVLQLGYIQIDFLPFQTRVLYCKNYYYQGLDKMNLLPPPTDL